MLARGLERALLELCSNADASHGSHEAMEARFVALRGYGRLPRTRGERGQPLTDTQIAHALLGMGTSTPGWAGHAATILASLQPVGGPEAAFASAPNFSKAIEALIASREVRQTLVSVRLSTAEAGENSNGYAQIVYEENGARRICTYISRMALSLTRAGGEVGFDHERRYAPASREYVFNRKFFKDLSRRIEFARSMPPVPEGDGAEYDSEEAKVARFKRLGANARSHYLTIGVDNQVTWPKEEMLVKFGEHELVLMPKTKDNVQSVSIDLNANKLSAEAALTLIHRMLSVMTWCDDQYAIAQGGWSGSPVPQPVAKRNLAFATAHQWAFYRAAPATEEARRALALYREARNAEQNFMVSYAVLNYYKIIEIKHHGHKASSAWVAQNLPVILAHKGDEERTRAFLSACGAEAPETYIYAACRVAVAHAAPNRVSDPDESAEIRRLYVAAGVMRKLARRFIKYELGVSDSPLTESVRG